MFYNKAASEHSTHQYGEHQGPFPSGTVCSARVGVGAAPSARMSKN